MPPLTDRAVSLVMRGDSFVSKHLPPAADDDAVVRTVETQRWHLWNATPPDTRWVRESWNFSAQTFDGKEAPVRQHDGWGLDFRRRLRPGTVDLEDIVLLRHPGGAAYVWEGNHRVRGFRAELASEPSLCRSASVIVGTTTLPTWLLGDRHTSWRNRATVQPSSSS